MTEYKLFENDFNAALSARVGNDLAFFETKLSGASESQRHSQRDFSDALVMIDRQGIITDLTPGFLTKVCAVYESWCEDHKGKTISDVSFLRHVSSNLLAQKRRAQEESPACITLPDSHADDTRPFINHSFESTIEGENEHSFSVSVREIIFLKDKEIDKILLLIHPNDYQEFIEEDLAFLTEEYEKLMRRYKEAHEEFLILKNMKTNFMSLTSHELLTPLQIIMGNLELFKTQVFGKMNITQQEKTNVIIRNTSRIYEITKSMYDLSRVKTRLFSLNKKSTDIFPLIKEIIADFSVLFEKNELKFHSKLPDKLPNIPLDKNKFWQTWSEIFDYTIHYSEPGEELFFSVEEKDENIRFTLKKTGTGVSKRHRRFLFESFYEPTNILHHKEGSGLGLTLAKKYVDAHGGEIKVESDKNDGITFSLLFPIKIPLEKSIEWKMLKAEKMSGFLNKL